MPRIQTTVVGSYPVPEWLVALPSEQALADATRVVIGIQEQAGIDLVCDGELYRFDVNHPETNGMIEYFVRPMDGITQRFSFEDLIAYRASSGMRFRTRPPGTVIGPIGSGALDLPLACARAKALANKPLKFTVTGPHMLAKTLIAAAQNKTAWGRAWHVPTNPPRTQRQAVEELAKAAGVAPVKASAVPNTLLRFLGLFNPQMREVLITMYQFEQPFIIDDTATRRELGLAPTRWEEVLQATVVK